MKKLTISLVLLAAACGCCKCRKNGDGFALREPIMRNWLHLQEERFAPPHTYDVPCPGWPGDFPGRIMLALVLEKEALGIGKCENLDIALKELPSHLNERGYMGEIYEGVFSEQQMSGNGWVLRALAEYAKYNPDSQTIDAKAIATRMAENLFLPALGKYKDYPLTPEERENSKGEPAGNIVGEVNGWLVSSDIGCLFVGLDGLVAAYQLTGDEKLKPAIDEIVAKLLEFDFVRVKAQTHATLSSMRALLRYDAQKYLAKVEDMFRIYREKGMTDDWENYNWFERYDTWTEPCGIADSLLVAEQLHRASGKAEYREMADRILAALLDHEMENGGFEIKRTFPKGSGKKSESTGTEAHWCCTMRGGAALAWLAISRRDNR